MGFITTATALGIAAASAAAGGIATSVLSNRKKASATPEVTPVNDTAASLETSAKDTANEEALKKRRARTKTVLTGPRGLLTQPKTDVNQLLGS